MSMIFFHTCCRANKNKYAKRLLNKNISYAVNYALYNDYIDQVNHGRSMVRALENHKDYEEHHQEHYHDHEPSHYHELKKNETFKKKDTNRKKEDIDPNQFMEFTPDKDQGKNEIL